jgi:hypothetical protein
MTWHLENSAMSARSRRMFLAHRAALSLVLSLSASVAIETSAQEGVWLNIDPGLEWATYLGGGSGAWDRVRAITFDSSGDVIVVGQTDSSDFPTTSGALDATYGGGGSGSGGGDVFISRFDRQSGALVYSTFLGGSGGDDPQSVSVSASGVVTVCGFTFSADFPVTHGTLPRGGATDLFVTRLSPDGSSILMSVVFGGNSIDDPRDMAVEDDGDVLIGGYTWSTDFPVTPGAFDASKGLNADGFLLRLNASGASLDFATYLGGDSSDSVEALSFDPLDNILIAGNMTEGSVPVTPRAFSSTANGPYVARFTPDGSSVLSSTYYGGLLSDPVTAIEVVSNGNVVVAGYTYSSDFPVTPGAFQTTSIGSLFTDGYVTCFDPGLTTLEYSTFITGGAPVEIRDLHVDAAGVVTIAGWTGGGVFPKTPGAFDTTHNGLADLFVSRLSPDGSKLLYSTFIGGTDEDGNNFGNIDVTLDVDPLGAAVVGSVSLSTDFPVTPGAFQPAHAGGPHDGVIAVIDMLPTGASRFGTSTPGCTGPLAIGVTAMAQVGKPFGLSCSNAPPLSTMGLLFLGVTPLSLPLTAKGVALWVDPVPSFLLVPVTSNTLGATWLEAGLPSDTGLVGATFFTQFFWPNPCGSPGTLSASNALGITIQL